MVLNDTLLSQLQNTSFCSDANTSFKDSFIKTEEEFDVKSVHTKIQKAHTFAVKNLCLRPLSLPQIQKSLIEVASLLHQVRECEEASDELRNLVLGVFVKLSANSCAALKKNDSITYALYRIAHGLISQLRWDGENHDDSEKTLHWLHALELETAVCVLSSPVNSLDRQSVWMLDGLGESVVDELNLTDDFFQSSIFDNAKTQVAEVAEFGPRTLLNKFKEYSEQFTGETELKLLLWATKHVAGFQSCTFLEDLLPQVEQVPDAGSLAMSSITVLDVKMFLVSLATYAHSTSATGLTKASRPTIVEQLTVTKQQLQCWEALYHIAQNGSSVSHRLRASRTIDAVRLMKGESEDVRILYDVWKSLLLVTASMDSSTAESIREISTKYKAKINSLLAYGPSYQTACQPASGARSVVDPRIFPLPCDYEFVDVVEADHIEAMINSEEGLNEILNNSADKFDETFQTAPSNESLLRESDFFSPLKHNRTSMLPASTTSAMHKSPTKQIFKATSSVIMTPTKEEDEESLETSFNISNIVNGGPPTFDDLVEEVQNEPYEYDVIVEEDEDVDEEDEEDELDLALKENERAATSALTGAGDGKNCWEHTSPSAKSDKENLTPPKLVKEQLLKTPNETPQKQALEIVKHTPTVFSPEKLVESLVDDYATDESEEEEEDDFDLEEEISDLMLQMALGTCMFWEKELNVKYDESITYEEIIAKCEKTEKDAKAYLEKITGSSKKEEPKPTVAEPPLKPRFPAGTKVTAEVAASFWGKK